MNQAAFASLIGVSGPMVSKYSSRGLLVRGESGEIDAVASLDLLEGHLSEDKRAKALAVLDQRTGGEPGSRPAKEKLPTARSGRALRDDIEAEMKALDLAERKRDLVLAADVDDKARDAVTIFRESRSNSRREIADKLCAQFGIASDRAPALVRFLAQEDEASLGAFAKAVMGIIDAATSETPTEPVLDAVAAT